MSRSQADREITVAVRVVEAGATAGDVRDWVRAGRDLLILDFRNVGEDAFGVDDADLASVISSAPAADRLCAAYADGPMSGRWLAHFLRCVLPIVGPNACLSAGYGRPGAASVYAAAAGRVGARQCERLLFDGGPLTSDQAVSSHLVFPATNVEAAVALARGRFATMLSVAKADAITWPFDRAVAAMLVDRAD